MANITPVQRAGSTQVTLAAATGGGDTIVNAVSGVILLVNNASGSPITVTLAEVVACNHAHALTNPTYTVGAGKVQHIPVPDFCLSATNTVAVTYSAVTSVTVAALL